MSAIALWIYCKISCNRFQAAVFLTRLLTFAKFDYFKLYFVFLLSTENPTIIRGGTVNSKTEVEPWKKSDYFACTLLSTRACFSDHYLNKFMEFVVSPHSLHLCLFESCPWIKIHNLKHTNQCLRTFFSELSPNLDRLKYLNNLSSALN